MKIAIVLYGAFPALRYGGTQRVVWSLGKALSQMGHHVVILAERCGWCPFAETIEIDRDNPISLQIPSDVDVVHFNGLHVGYNTINKPYVITIHGNNEVRQLDPNMVFVSCNHASRHGSESYVYNGLDWDMYSFVDITKKRKFFHFLGNASWRVKNVCGAISTVTHTPHEHLHVLGGTRLNFHMGFRLTFSSRVHFHGLVDDSEKKQILSQSKGLVFPVTWHEPFGLTIIESLYLGCPIYGTPYGALPELITDDIGVLSNRRSVLTDAIQEIGVFSPMRCHEYARDLFNARVMAKAYLEKYERVLNGESLSMSSLVEYSEYKNLPWLD